MLPAIGYAIPDHQSPHISDPSIRAAEICLERANSSLRVDRYLENRNYDLVSLRAWRLSVAGDDAPTLRDIDALKAIAQENGAQSVSDHLCVIRSNDNQAEMTHIEPPPYTRDSLNRTCRNIKFIQKQFGNIRFFIGNIVQSTPRIGKLTEAQFLSRVLERTGCGWLLDVTTVYANAMNFGADPYDFIEEVMPSASRVQIHITGGCRDEFAHRHVVGTSHAVPEPVWDLYRFALEMAHVRAGAVFLARDQNIPDEMTWRQEFQTAREISEEVGAIA